LDEEEEKEDEEDQIDNGVSTSKETINVNIGDRIVTLHGYTGVVRYEGGVHFDEYEILGIELDQWSPNGHSGVIHGHQYFPCREGRGYFIRPNGIEKNLGPTRRRRKSRTASMMDLSLIVKNLKIGDHVRLTRAKTGIVKWMGKASDVNPNDVGNDEQVVGVELDKWAANGNDGKHLFTTAKGRGYFTRRSSVANIVLPNDTKSEAEIANLKRLISKTEKKLKDIEILEEKQRGGMVLDSQQITRIDRKKHLKIKLNELRIELDKSQ